MENLKQLVIIFGDNDFYQTFSKMGDCLLLAEKALPPDREKLAFLISELSFSMYVLYQNPFKYNGMENMDKLYIDHMRSYLSVEPRDILINEDAVNFQLKKEWYNSEALYIDFENKQCNIF